MMRSLYWVTVTMPFLASPALAHAFLERAEPSVGSEVPTSPHELVLTFTEGVEASFSSVQLRDSSGATVATAKPQTQAGNNRKLVVQLPALHGGTYTVIWHATSVDTHKTEGKFQFSIAH